MTHPILQVTDLTKRFKGITAVDQVSFVLDEGHIKSIIGPNGAGKTTLINLITGTSAPTAGSVFFKGQPIQNNKPHQIAAAGIARTFQTVELFKNMTVLENVMVGCHLRGKREILASAFRLPGFNSEEQKIVTLARQQLQNINLAHYADQKAGNLPLGEQKMLEIARALATHPSLLLLDEPVAGLNEAETQRATEMILRIKSQGITIILVEHDMKVVMRISDEILVINYGKRLAEGKPREVQRDPRVIEAYLGGDISDACR